MRGELKFVCNSQSSSWRQAIGLCERTTSLIVPSTVTGALYRLCERGTEEGMRTFSQTKYLNTIREKCKLVQFLVSIGLLGGSAYFMFRRRSLELDIFNSIVDLKYIMDSSNQSNPKLTLIFNLIP